MDGHYERKRLDKIYQRKFLHSFTKCKIILITLYYYIALQKNDNIHKSEALPIKSLDKPTLT